MFFANSPYHNSNKQRHSGSQKERKCYDDLYNHSILIIPNVYSKLNPTLFLLEYKNILHLLIKIYPKCRHFVVYLNKRYSHLFDNMYIKLHILFYLHVNNNRILC